jgi:hypothetical protein
MTRFPIAIGLLTVATAGCPRQPVGSAHDGAPTLVTDHFKNDRYVVHTLVRPAGSDTTDTTHSREFPAIVGTVSEIVTADRARATILRVAIGHASEGDYEDSVLVRRSDLRPVWSHFSLSPKLDIRVNYENGILHVIRKSNDLVKTFDRLVTTPLFAHAEASMVLRSLPLQSGYTITITVYNEGHDAFEMDTVTVLNARPDEWTVRLAGPDLVEVFGINPADRRITSSLTSARRSSFRARDVFERPQ